jgi:hypothetical protein
MTSIWFGGNGPTLTNAKPGNSHYRWGYNGNALRVGAFQYIYLSIDSLLYNPKPENVIINFVTAAGLGRDDET